MASQADIDAFGESLADDVSTAERTYPPAVITPEAVENVIRPWVMKRGFAKAFATALDPPWLPVAPKTSSDPEAAKFGTGWANNTTGWALAAYRKIALLGKVELRGYILTASAANTLIMTLPPLLRPAQNELFATVIDNQPATINVWIDGTVSVYFAEATTRQIVTLSGISWKVAT